MSDLTDAARSTIASCAARYGLSEGAVEHMARAVANGGGSMAQFNVPELGGSGQWMYGGMTMVGDMFNQGLQARVSNLCTELSDAMARATFFAAPQGMQGGQGSGQGSGSWWPAGLGQPSSSGGQNQARYALFPDARRIAFDSGNGAPVVVLDTLDHWIGGFSQQQSGPGAPFQGVSFSSQYGQFALSSLPRADERGGTPPQAAPQAAPQPLMPAPMQVWAPMPDPTPEAAAAPAPAPSSSDPHAILAVIERLASLRDVGALTEDEYAAKKAELLSRL
jgi:hypothetical protein